MTGNQNQIIRILQKAYPDAGCELDFGTAFQLLVAVILSAQCTDRRVNAVTDKLFKIASTPADFAAMPQEELEKHIFSCGFYRAKAKNIKAMSQDILDKFGGDIPDTMEQLTSLAGVGRKTANVVLSVAFGKNAIAVDTHVFRVSHRLGFSQGKTPDAVEKDLLRLFEGELLGIVHHVLIFHGRYCCHSRKPDCPSCTVREHCPYVQKTKG